MIESLKIELEDLPWNVLIKFIFIEKSLLFSTTRTSHPDVHLKNCSKNRKFLSKTSVKKSPYSFTETEFCGFFSRNWRKFHEHYQTNIFLRTQFGDCLCNTVVGCVFMVRRITISSLIMEILLLTSKSLFIFK